MKKYLSTISLITLACFTIFYVFLINVDALELVRQRDTNTVIVFPIIGTGGMPYAAIGTTDTEVDHFADGSNPDGFADMAEPTHISGGFYYIAMTSDELDHEHIIIRVQASTSAALTQAIIIRTIVGDPAYAAVTDDGTAINVASGVVEANVEQIADDAVTDNADGRLEVNVEEWNDTAVKNQVAGYPDINVVFYASTTVETSVSGMPDVNIVYVQEDAVTDGGDGLLQVNVIEIESVDATDQLDSHDGNPPSTATIADGVWDEVIVGAHDGANAAGALLDTPGDWATSTNITQIEGVDATDQLDTAASTVTVTALAANVITSASINDGAISDADVDDDVMVDVKTIETVDATNQLNTAADTVTVTSIGANVITDASMAADVDTLVNDEVKDVLLTDTASEPGQGAPPASPTIEQMIHYLYKYFRNKIVTSADTIELYNDAGAVVDQKWAINDDDSEFTRDEVVTGP